MVEIGRNPGCRRVAIVTVVATRDVRRVLALGGHTIMTGETGADDLQVINRICGIPDNVVVAVLAYIRRIDVGQVFARRFGSVVATFTGINNACVIEICGNPRRRCMAIVAVITARHVRCMLAGRRGPVVA